MDPEGLVTFEAGDKKYTAVFGFKAMKATEAHYDKPFFRAIQSAMPSGDGADIRLTDVAVLFKFALLKHQPKLTDSDIEDLIDEIGLEKTSEVIGEALAASVGEDDDSSTENPPPKSRKRKTG